MAFTHARHSEATPLLSDLHSKHVEEANQADSRNVDATPLPRAQLLCILLIFMYEPIQIKFENPFINEVKPFLASFQQKLTIVPSVGP